MTTKTKEHKHKFVLQTTSGILPETKNNYPKFVSLTLLICDCGEIRKVKTVYEFIYQKYAWSDSL